MVEAPNVKSDIYFMPLGAKQAFGLLLFKKPSDQRFNSKLDLFDYCKQVTAGMQDKGSVQTSGVYLP